MGTDGTIDDAGWASLVAAWPGVVLSRAAFEAFLGASRIASREAASPDAAGALAPAFEELSDLFIAFACGKGDSRAIALFGRHFAPVLESVRRRFGSRAPSHDELLADVNERLFAPRDGSEPRILAFRGESSLAGWLKVVATRIVLNRLAAEKATDPVDDERLLDVLGIAQPSAEHLLHREEARAHFKAAFARCVNELGARERQLLRLAFVEGLTIDDLGRLYDVHRTTAFRWLQQASERLAAELRRSLRESLRLSDAEYDRWCESVRSGLELSMQRYFGATG